MSILTIDLKQRAIASWVLPCQSCSVWKVPRNSRNINVTNSTLTCSICWSFQQNFHQWPFQVPNRSLPAKSQKLCPEFTVCWAFEALRIWNACLADRQCCHCWAVVRVQLEKWNIPELQENLPKVPPDLKLVVNYKQNPSYLSWICAWAKLYNEQVQVKQNPYTNNKVSEYAYEYHDIRREHKQYEFMVVYEYYVVLILIMSKHKCECYLGKGLT